MCVRAIVCMYACVQCVYEGACVRVRGRARVLVTIIMFGVFRVVIGLLIIIVHSCLLLH